MDWYFVDKSKKYHLVLDQSEMGYVCALFFAGGALLEPDQWVISLGQRAVQLQTGNVGKETATAILDAMSNLDNDRGKHND